MKLPKAAVQFGQPKETWRDLLPIVAYAQVVKELNTQQKCYLCKCDTS